MAASRSGALNFFIFLRLLKQLEVVAGCHLGLECFDSLRHGLRLQVLLFQAAKQGGLLLLEILNCRTRHEVRNYVDTLRQVATSGQS